jgi:two-component system sensor histidine kinase/response regulator
MPEMDGVEATRQIRQFGSKISNSAVPIIAMTANALETDRKQCLAAGMDGFVSKPLKPAELEQMIMRCGQDADESIDLPTVNLQELNQMRSDIRHEFEPLAQIFIDQLPVRIGKMQVAIAEKNPQQLEEIAHKLRGTSAGFYAEKMAELCLKIEQSAKHNQTGVSQWLTLLEQEAGNIKRILQAEMHSV